MPRSRDGDSAPPLGGQSYVERPPVPALSGLASSVWIQRVSPDAEPYTQRNVPNGAVELHCPLGAVPRIVGPLTPKTLHRVLRFQAFLALAQYAIARGQAPAGDGLARLAADAGYADQSHLSRECLRLTGLAPGAFLGEAESACACGHDHAASFAPVLQMAGLFKPGARGRP